MIRIFAFLAIVVALGIGFSWLAERPGDLLMTFGGYQYRFSLMVAAVILVAVIAAIMISWWLIKSIWNSPHAITRHFRVRRRDRGYQALSTGMIAAGAGDSALARRKKQEAMKLISADQEPLIHLLDAQASLLEGDHQGAREKFEAMLKDPELRLLGLRGLYLEAERLGETEAARHYAQQAVEQAPQLGWASNAALETMAMSGDWNGAIALVDRQKASRQVDRDYGQRRKAVLLTAKAFDLIEADPTGARNAAVEANRLAPDLIPASIAAARAMFRLGDLRKGAKILETAWKKEPQAEIADAYVHARPGDSVQDRLARAKKLAAIRPSNVESCLVVARAALEAGEYALARKEVEAAVRLDPREGAFLLLADIEEQETGEEGRVRQWLAKAVRAPRDPAWVADGVVAERWAPVSPVTGRLDAFEWRAPVERLGPAIDMAEREAMLQLSSPPSDDDDDDDAVLIEVEPAKPVEPKASVDPIPVKPEPIEAKAAPAAVQPEVAKAIVAEATSDRPPLSMVAEPAEPVVDPDKGRMKEPTTDQPVATPRAAAQVPAQKPAEPPLRLVSTKPEPTEETSRPPVPDDPGVDPDDVEKAEPARFKLF